MAKGSEKQGWGAMAAEVWTGVSDWRAAHPKATFSEIEREVDSRLGVLRTRMMEDVALASAAVDITTLGEGSRPVCGECGGQLQAHGQQKREIQTMRGDAVSLSRSYAVCRACGTGVFPPR